MQQHTNVRRAAWVQRDALAPVPCPPGQRFPACSQAAPTFAESNKEALRSGALGFEGRHHRQLPPGAARSMQHRVRVGWQRQQQQSGQQWAGRGGMPPSLQSLQLGLIWCSEAQHPKSSSRRTVKGRSNCCSLSNRVACQTKALVCSVQTCNQLQRGRHRSCGSTGAGPMGALQQEFNHCAPRRRLLTYCICPLPVAAHRLR